MDAIMLLAPACVASEKTIVGVLRSLDVIKRGSGLAADQAKQSLEVIARECHDRQDLAPLLQLLLQPGDYKSVQGEYLGDAMQVASYKGNMEIVRLLLEQGAEVNTQGGKYGNALQAASIGGHMAIVQLLLEKTITSKSRLMGQGSIGISARISAGASLSVGTMVETTQTDVNAQGGEYGNALQAASYKGHMKIVQLLLEKGAEVNAQGGKYGNALQAASCGGHMEIVQLLEKRAHVNT
jgi:ankyrin repeat protein